MSIEQYLSTAPKAELHVHLEGSIQPATLLTLAQRNGVKLPVRTLAEMQDWFTFRDFNHFVEVYVDVSKCLKTSEDYELITYEFGANMARQHIRYAEVTFSPSTHYYTLGISHDTYFSGLTRGRERARADFGVEIRWIFDIVRNIEDEARRHKLADFVTAVAIEGKEDGVVALGLGGAEDSYPPEQFAPWFEKALAAGLHSAPHAGEMAGPQSVWGAIRTLGAERIGHGVRSIEDSALVEYLAGQRIPLEVCPTSNLKLGVYSDYAQHPLPHLHAAGVVVTVNSDDPPLFNTTLNDEVQLLAAPFQLDLQAVNEILLNGVRHSFLPPQEKRAMETAFRAEMRQRQQELGL
ncbi:MAG: adenosine deaminase [Ktedonobacteraceae bacterium]|nr:adenosine deaminase [Ktedonobacteraceae bacterium]